jgi:hypothetical protein
VGHAEILRSGIDSTLLGMGLSSVHQLSPEHLVVPDGFLGAPQGTTHATQPSPHTTVEPASVGA